MNKTILIEEARFDVSTNIYDWQTVLDETTQFADDMPLNFHPDNSVNGITGLQAAQIASAALTKLNHHNIVPFSDEMIAFHSQGNPNFLSGYTAQGNVLRGDIIKSLYAHYINTIFNLGVEFPTGTFYIC